MCANYILTLTHERAYLGAPPTAIADLNQPSIFTQSYSGPSISVSMVTSETTDTEHEIFAKTSFLPCVFFVEITAQILYLSSLL